ncbi:MAG: hypothetical protein QM773_07640 [Hyphomonadaceae bacterium]
MALFDASGDTLGKAGQLSGLLGPVMPSRDRAQASRWTFKDAQGSLIAPTNWPSERALRGEVHTAGMLGRYRDGGEHLIKVTSVPATTVTNGNIAMAFLQHIDRSGRCAEGSCLDLEQRFIETLMKAISAA